MDLIITFFFISLCVIFFIGSRRAKIENNNSIIEEEKKKLQNEVNLLAHKLHDLKNQETELSSHKTSRLRVIEEKVIQNYDKSNIRIPLDIIEDLSYMKLDNEKDIENFIEVQRNYWKLENSKKVFKKGK